MSSGRERSRPNIGLLFAYRISLALGTMTATFGLFLAVVVSTQGKDPIQGVVIGIIALGLAAALWAAGFYFYRRSLPKVKPGEGDVADWERE